MYCNCLKFIRYMQEDIYKIHTLIKEHTKHALSPRKSFGTISIDIITAYV